MCLLLTPTAAQAAEAKFIRALALYYLLDLYGQYPFRNPGEDLRLAPVVKSGAEAVDFIIAELNAALPNLSATNGPDKANPDAARVLLMKCYLQKRCIRKPCCTHICCSRFSSGNYPW